MYQGKELETILPHKGTIIMLERIISYDLKSRKLISETIITPKTMLFDVKTRTVPTCISIEIMAQTIGTLSGIYLKENEKMAAKLGFVIGSRNCEFFTGSFHEGQILITEVEQLFFDSELGAFNCKITSENKLLAQAQLNVFQPVSLENFLQKNAQ